MFRILKFIILFVCLILPSIAFSGHYDGADWQDDDCYYYDGADWQSCTKKYYDGDSWEDLDATANNCPAGTYDYSWTASEVDESLACYNDGASTDDATVGAALIVSGKAVIDAVDEYVRWPYPNGSSIYSAGTCEFDVDTPSSFNNAQDLIVLSYNSSNYVAAFFTTSGGARVYIRYQGSGSGSNQCYSSGLPTSGSYHITVSWNQSTKYQHITIDGVDEDECPSLTMTAFASAPIDAVIGDNDTHNASGTDSWSVYNVECRPGYE